MNLTKTISTTVDSLARRVVKVLRYGRDDVQSGYAVAPFGVDSNPIKDMVAVYAPTGTKGETVVIGYINKNHIAGIGELRQYSTDEDGEEQFYLWLRNNGTIEIGGDAKNVARYQELETAFNELRDDFNTLVLIFNGHSHSGVTPGGGITGVTTATGSQSAADITGAKIDEIKCL